YYESQIDKFTPPPRSMINRVVVEANEERTLEQAKEMADDLHAQVQALIASATDFAGKRKVIQQYAYQYSDTPDGSYNYGYCIIYHLDGIEETFGKEFVDEVLKTPEGELSPVVPCVNGYGFFLVKEKESMGVQPFDSPPVQALLPQLIMQEKLESWRESLRKKYQVNIHKDQLRQNLPEPSAPAPSSNVKDPIPPIDQMDPAAPALDARSSQTRKVQQ
ncbi:peptidyl-prolyl cis-trans isomerase, partial [bacterium]|nr:peptidyl-prolyl cis-trans isomerase [bacterium]